MSPLDNLVGEVTANNLAEGLDHLEHCATTTGAEVPGLDTRLVLAEIVERGKVTAGKIEDVDVVANRSAILGGVVCGMKVNIP